MTPHGVNIGDFDIEREPLCHPVVWNWFHGVPTAYYNQPSRWEEADLKSRLQLSDTSSMPKINVVFSLCRKSLISYILGNNTQELSICINVVEVISFQIMTICFHIYPVRHANPPCSEQKFRVNMYTQNWNLQLVIRMRHSLHSKQVVCGQRHALCYVRVNFFWKLVYHTKQSTSTWWHKTQASPQFSRNCQQLRGVYVDGLVQERRNPIVNALELRLPCTNPLTRCRNFSGLHSR